MSEAIAITDATDKFPVEVIITKEPATKNAKQDLAGKTRKLNDGTSLEKRC